MELKISCAMCGKEKVIYAPTDKGSPEALTIGQFIADNGWIWQRNGEHFDIYCSKKCT